MEDPFSEDWQRIVSSILTKDLALGEATIDRVFAPDTLFIHPTLVIRGKEGVKRLFGTLARCSYKIENVRVEKTFIDREKLTVMTEVRYHIHPLFFPSKTEIRVLSLFTLRLLRPEEQQEAGEEGKEKRQALRWVIASQEDFYNPSEVITSLFCPFSSVRPMVKSGLDFGLRMMGIFVSSAVWAGVYIFHQSLHGVGQAAQGVKGRIVGQTAVVQEKMQ